MTRVNELLRREIGDAILHIANEAELDLSAVTVTHVVTSRSLRHARVLVSIRDHLDERTRMLACILRHRTQIQQRINKNLFLKYTPRLSFELDGSIEKGDRVLNLLSQLTVDGEIDTEVQADIQPPEPSEDGKRQSDD